MTHIVPPRKWAYIIFAFFFIGTSILSLIFLYQHFGDGTSFLELRKFRYETLYIIGIMLIMYYVFDALRLFYIIRALDIKISFLYVLKLVFINIFISNITPFATGGGFAQIYFLNKKGISIGNSTAATTIRTVIATVFFLITTPIIIFTEKSLIDIFSKGGGIVYVFLIIFIYFVLIYICYKFIYRTKIIKGIIFSSFNFLERKKLISNRRNKKWSRSLYKEIDTFSNSIKSFAKGEPKYILLSIGFAIIYLFTLFYFSVVLINGLGYHIPVISIISFQVLITFIMYFAITPGASGIAEGGYTLIYSNFIKRGDIISLTFTWRFVTVYIGMVIGGIIFYKEMFKSGFPGGYINAK
ncbi:MAG: flippase-like domain-containing protein [Epulopiscium sp.]|nr:flippase-like domain-containing protein [Candidatus Epulonipiscium sp.]